MDQEVDVDSGLLTCGLCELALSVADFGSIWRYLLSLSEGGGQSKVEELCYRTVSSSLVPYQGCMWYAEEEENGIVLLWSLAP